jgi:hypothetical protein
MSGGDGDAVLAVPELWLWLWLWAEAEEAEDGRAEAAGAATTVADERFGAAVKSADEDADAGTGGPVVSHCGTDWLRIEAKSMSGRRIADSNGMGGIQRVGLRF